MGYLQDKGVRFSIYFGSWILCNCFEKATQETRDKGTKMRIVTVFWNIFSNVLRVMLTFTERKKVGYIQDGDLGLH